MNDPMRDWQRTLDGFLTAWRERDITEAALLYGSYATGAACNDSDLDLLILLHEDSPPHPPFLNYVDGILIEAFFLTPSQVRQFWAIHHSENTRVSAVQWLDGKILFDRHAIAAQLKQEAAEWIDKPFVRPSREAQYWPLRSLWQGAEHLRALAKMDDPSFPFAANVHLNKLCTCYAKALGEPIIEPHRLYRYFTDPQLRNRYHMTAFADHDFATRASALLSSPIDAKRLNELIALTTDVIARIEGFHAPGLAKSAASSNDL